MEAKLQKKYLYQRFAFQWLLCFCICLLVHIPYFLGRHCSFDGDEAILGIMAQDLLHGKNIPVYFYGQQYGFSFFEVIGAAIGIFFFGSTAFALKFGSLLFFSLGITFLFRLFIKKEISFLWALMAIIILSMFPGWIVWAAKARGGYVTAFTAACIILFISQVKTANLKWIVISCFVMAVAIHSQIFIACSISFLLFAWIVKGKSLKLFLGATVSIILFYVLLKLPSLVNDNYWKVPLSFKYHYSSIVPFIKQSYKVALGYFYYEMTFKPRIESIWFGMGYYLVAAIAVVFVLLKKGASNKLNLVLLFIAGTVSFLLIMWMRIPSYRYLLGALTALLFIISLSLMEILRSKNNLKYVLILMLPLAIGFSNTSKHIPDAWMLPEGRDMKLYNELLIELKKRDIQAVFSADPLLQWQLNYSGVPSRSTSRIERINRYVDKVDKCFYNDKCKTAIVGFKGFNNNLDSFEDWSEKVIIVNDKYFIFEDPTSEHLIKAGFEFNP